MYRQNQALVALVRPVIEAMDYELWGVEYVAGARRSLLRIYIDSRTGITVDDCERVSHEVTGALDVNDPVRGPYDLEVSSPGLDRPLFTLDQFRRFAGQEVRIRLKAKMDGRRRLTGYIEGVEENAIRLRTGDDEHVALPPDAIEKARLVPQF